MRAIFIIEMKRNMQDKGLYFWTFILPIIFTILFITVLTSGQPSNIQKEITISIIPGYTVMFVFFIMITMVNTFIKDQQTGMAARLASTPLSSTSYLIGKWISYIIIVVIQITVLLVFGRIVYQIPFQQPLLLSILALALTFTVTGLGLALAFLVKTDNMGIAITQVIALGGAILGGLWMPIDTMPVFMQTTSKFLPQYWAHQAFQNAMQGTLLVSDFLLVMLILIGFGLFGLLIARLRYPVFLKQARN